MAEVDIKVTEHFDEAQEKMSLAIRQCLEELGQSAVEFTQRLTPVVTGRLRNSMTYVTKYTIGENTYHDKDGRAFDGSLSVKADSGEVYFGTNVEYAMYVENGRKGKNGRHMIKQAAEGHRAYYKATIEKYLASALK